MEVPLNTFWEQRSDKVQSARCMGFNRPRGIFQGAITSFVFFGLHVRTHVKVLLAGFAVWIGTLGRLLVGWKATEGLRGTVPVCKKSVYLLYGVPVDPLRHPFAKQSRASRLDTAKFSTFSMSPDRQLTTIKGSKELAVR